MLQISFIFTALAIVISNGILLYKRFMKRCKTRTDESFITLNCYNISVRSFSIPIVSIPLLKWDVSALDYTHRFIWIISACFLYDFSWISLVTIAFARVIVTKGQIYKQYITMKTLYWIITFCLLYILAIVIINYNLLKQYSSNGFYTTN